MPLPRDADAQQGLSLLAAFVLTFLCAAAFFGVGLVYGQAAPEASAPFAIGALTPDASPGYAGSNACAACHATQVSAWRGSQHAKAMQTANAQTVLGDFNNARANHFASTARFYQKDGRYYVETDGIDGEQAEFEIAYTFGLEPLQQYLVRFPDGRVQGLPFAWDTREKSAGGQRWFHLYPDEAVPHGDALHWTGAQQNWNFMCADCHSTDVAKKYDAQTKTFATSFSEISVGCETCHGPAASHVTWANGDRAASEQLKGFASVAAKREPPDWTPDAATGSPTKGVARPVGDELDTCGTCHTRRLQFAEGWRPGKPLTDFYRPALLMPDLFEADGQMRDEVFNLSSFQQSKMHAKGVVCSDCHEPHSGKLKPPGSAVCSQCHLPEKFEAAAHTGHKTAAGQPDCIACHMPARTYMVVDARHDHSFRIPRPDLSQTLGTPNACNDCHTDKPAAWAAAAVRQWHGAPAKGFQTYAPAFHAAQTDHPDARALLLDAAKHHETPALARATALALLQARPSTEALALALQGLQDRDPMVRIAALEYLETIAPEQRWRHGAHLLSDDVRAVRLQAAFTLAQGPGHEASQAVREAFEKASQEFVEAERFNADRADARARLARFFLRQAKTVEAEKEYLAALSLDQSVSPRIDLADLYRALGREAESEKLLRETLKASPAAAAAHHALGLSLIRTRRHEEGLEALRQAHHLQPAQPRYAYVYAIALESQGRKQEALGILNAAAQSSPSNVEILQSLLRHALDARDFSQAHVYAQRLSVALPDGASMALLARRIQEAAKQQK